MMEKQLDGLRWRPRWVSLLGCMKGCLEYLGLDMSWPWLYGGTGHAFIINIHKVICPSGPTAWRYEMLPGLASNLGFTITGVRANRHESSNMSARQEQAWAHVRASLDKGLPCYGWELRIPEYYVIYGHDDAGYYFSGPGCDDGSGPMPWQDVGTSDIGMLEISSIEPASPASDEQIVRDAFSFAVEHAGNPAGWILPDYRSGTEGYDLWADKLERGLASRFGQGYNGVVWAECRKEAVDFLKEAKERLSGKADSLFDEAIAHYSTASEKLQALAEMHPFQIASTDEDTDQFASPEGATLVRQAGYAERNGLRVLERIAKTI